MPFSNLYIHVPFCHRKCRYCAFYSEPDFKQSHIDAWLDRLAIDMAKRRHEAGRLDSIYIGGGTPTALPVQSMTRLFDMLKDCFEIQPGAEIGMECNPGSLDHGKATAIASLVNRVSMGAQSFNPKMLEAIGRNGGGLQSATHTFNLLRDAGINNIGLDLIYALPGQSLDEWENDLETAVRLEPCHISAYSLSVEDGTALATQREGLELPDDDSAAEMWETAGALLADAGLPRYEISNYASKDFECLHNQSVWHGETYLGLGPSASSFDGSDRWTEPAPLSAWISGAKADFDTIPKERRAREIFIMGLRTVRGWRKDEFRRAANLDWSFMEQDIAHMESSGLLHVSDDEIKPSKDGLLFWNSLAEGLL